MDGTSLCGLTHSQAVATLKATINLDQVVLGIMDGPETSFGKFVNAVCAPLLKDAAPIQKQIFEPTYALWLVLPNIMLTNIERSQNCDKF